MGRALHFLLLLTATATFAQRNSAPDLEKRGDQQFYDFNYLTSARMYEEAFQRDTSNIRLQLKIADSYRLAHEPDRARRWYDRVFNNPQATIGAAHKVSYATVLIALGLQDEARKLLLAYQEQHGPDPLVTAQLKGLANVDAFEKNRALFAVKAVDFNSAGMDFSPFPYRNGLVFVSSRTIKGASPDTPEGFLNLLYTEEAEDGRFSPPVAMTSGNHSAYHEGPVVFFDKEQKKIISRNLFVKNGRMKDGSVNTLSLAQSTLSAAGVWSEPAPLPFASSEFSVAHPAISADGTTLYFASNMPGTEGESDLFVSKFENGSWSKPRNLGAEINTPGQELFPFLFNDSTLFFASNGHSGLGGLDLFYCNLRDGHPAVENLGAPVNSPADDFGIFVEQDGSSGFFSSNRPGGKGADDVYYFEEIRPFASIQLYDSLTRRPVKGAGLTLMSNDAIVGQTKSDFQGQAEFRLSPLRDYTLSVSAAGYQSPQIELTPALWPASQVAQVKVYMAPLYQTSAVAGPLAIRTRQRTSLTNEISFSSSALDVDVVAEATGQPVDTTSLDGMDNSGVPRLTVVAAEVVNDLPSIIVVKNDTIHALKTVSASTIAGTNLNVQIDIPQGARRNDYEKIITEQVMLQGYAIAKFLLIRSFFFDSGKTWVRNDACAQLDKIVDVMTTYGGLKVQMIFHSDSRGTDSFNLDLSKARAEEVKTYLERAGIRPERILSHFVGESNLLNDCGDLADCDELLHQTNRSVEFKFILE